jgi:hypothetical protein
MQNDQSKTEDVAAVVQQRIVSRLVDRFLNWPLPKSVCSDPCVIYHGYANRTGTNLLTATEAEEMIRHLLGPTLSKESTTEEEGESFTQGFFEGVEHQKSANDKLRHGGE